MSNPKTYTSNLPMIPCNRKPQKKSLIDRFASKEKLKAFQCLAIVETDSRAKESMKVRGQKKRPQTLTFNSSICNISRKVTNQGTQKINT